MFFGVIGYVYFMVLGPGAGERVQFRHRKIRAAKQLTTGQSKTFKERLRAGPLRTATFFLSREPSQSTVEPVDQPKPFETS